jgi:hypothetical protein
MADNVRYPATGDIVATLASDDVGGIQYPRTKMSFGADGTATDVSDATPMPSKRMTGKGAFTSLPTPTTNGAAITGAPNNASGVQFYLPTGSSVTYTIAATAPTSAPTLVRTISNTNNGDVVGELLDGQNIYITAATGSPFYRWM